MVNETTALDPRVVEKSVEPEPKFTPQWPPLQTLDPLEP